MKKYFCDVCGAEIAQGGNAPPSPTAELCELEDLCPRCDGFARELDASALVLRELRRMAAKQEAHRREHGPGSIPKLARLAKVAESELRNMISCAPVPIATWRKVGRALGVSGAGGNGGNDEKTDKTN